jgi:hypothetical protein
LILNFRVQEQTVGGSGINGAAGLNGW